MLTSPFSFLCQMDNNTFFLADQEDLPQLVPFQREYTLLQQINMFFSWMGKIVGVL